MKFVDEAHAEVRPSASHSVEAARKAGVGVIRQELIEEFPEGLGFRVQGLRSGGSSLKNFLKVGGSEIFSGAGGESQALSVMSRVKHGYEVN